MMTVEPHHIMSRTAVTRSPGRFDAFLRDHPDLTHVDAIFFDICGRPIGKRLPLKESRKIYEKGLQLPFAMFNLDVTGECLDPLGRGISDGDPDGYGWPLDCDPLPAPWTAEPAAIVLMGMMDEAGNGAIMDPRWVLARSAARFAELGLIPVTAIELEFYLIAHQRGPRGEPQQPASPVTGIPNMAGNVYGFDALDLFAPVMRDIEHWCRALGVPTTAVTSEVAPGQFEINLAHGPDPVKAADDAALLRHVVRKAAHAHGLDATFMAKPYPEMTGNGMHVHISVVDAQGSNVFDDGTPQGSALLRQAVAGMAALMPESMAVFAPSLNAYRRLKPNNFVPVTPDWSVNNRSAAFRVPAGDGAARRIEHRIAGADANPYLVMAAVLAAVHHGIANRLEPGPAITGNAGMRSDPDVPLTLPEALDRLKTARHLPGYLGADYTAIYGETKRGELARLLDEISPREYGWYL